MSIKERLEQIEREGPGLANRLDQKQKLEDLKQQLYQEFVEGRLDSKLKEILLDTGILDMLAEVVDYIPEISVIITRRPQDMRIYADFAILFQWEHEGKPGSTQPWKELGIILLSDKISIYTALYSTHNASHTDSRFMLEKTRYYGDTLTPEQWRNRERLEASIADALWAAGIRLNTINQ